MRPSTPMPIRHLDIRGQTHLLPLPDKNPIINQADAAAEVNCTGLHPVLQVLYKRRLEGSRPGQRTDGHRVALAIEGGGMRGCVGAGMVCALKQLNLTDCFDVIYGSSAGSLVGAYFISGQVPYEGGQVYYDWLPAAGK